MMSWKAGALAAIVAVAAVAGAARPASGAVPALHASPYDDGYARGVQECKNGRIPASYLPVPAQPAKADAMQFYRGWWDGCDWAWAIPQDWRLKNVGPAPRADTNQPAVDVAEYDEGFDLGRRACTRWGWGAGSLRANEERADFVRGYSRGCDIASKMQLSNQFSTRGANAWDASSYLDVYGSCYADRAASSNFNSVADRTRTAMQEGCKDALDDLAAGVKSAVDTAPRPAQAKRLPPDANFLARRADDDERLYAQGHSAGLDGCRDGIAYAYPIDAGLRVAYGNGWDLGCDQALAAFAKANPRRRVSQRVRDAGNYDEGELRGELDCRYGRVLPDLPDPTTFGSEFVRGWNDACDAVMMRRFGAVVGQPAANGMRDHSSAAYQRLAAADGDYKNLLPAAASIQSLLAHGTTVSRPPARAPTPAPTPAPTRAGRSPARQAGRVTATSAVAALPFDPADPKRRPHLEKREVARGTIDDWTSRGLLDVHDAKMIAADSSHTIGIVHATPITPADSSRSLDQHHAGEIKADSSAAIGRHDARGVEQHQSTGIDQHTASGVEQHRASDIDQHQSTEVQQQQSTGVQQHRAREVEQQKAKDVQQHQANEVEQHKAAEIQQRQASEIEQHKATEIQQHKSTDVQEHKAAEIQQRQASEIEQHKAAEIQQRQASEVEQHKAAEIQQHQATEIQQHKATEIQQHQATEIQQHQATEIQQHQATEIQQHKATEIQQHQATEIQQHKATEIQQHQATEIQQHRATEIQPYQSKEIQPYHAAEPPSTRAAAAAPGTARYQGRARNGSYSGKLLLDFAAPLSGDGAVSARLVFSEGLSGGGPLTGTVNGGALRLAGTISDGSNRYALTLQGTMSDDGSISGSYRVQWSGGSQTATFNVAPSKQ